MKTYIGSYLFVFLILIYGCKKNENEGDNTTIITTEISDITFNSALGGGEITSEGKLPIILRGVCWNLEREPKLSDKHSTDGGGAGKYYCNIENLNANTTYFVKAYCINKNDTIFGNQISFKTPNNILFNPCLIYDTLSDIDGNVYKTIVIGNKTWMAENLRVTRYNNGDPLKNISDSSVWSTTQQFGVEFAYCDYDNDKREREIYGLLYTHGVVSERYADNRIFKSIAPKGWHIPTLEEWTEMISILGADSIVGCMLKESGSMHWKIQNEGTNLSGFTALPSGWRSAEGQFLGRGEYARFWCSTYDVARYYPGYSVFINSNNNAVFYGLRIFDFINNGFSIRCVKN
jgi:uncharacterized protein (TIGR02145 family)